jgi:hypothetical protein
VTALALTEGVDLVDDDGPDPAEVRASAVTAWTGSSPG